MNSSKSRNNLDRSGPKSQYRPRRLAGKRAFTNHLIALLSFAITFLLVIARANAGGSVTDTDRATVLLVIGAPGQSEYATNFLQQADLWQKVCAEGGACALTVGVEYPPGTNDHDKLRDVLAAQSKESATALWVVLIGHGTFDGKEAWFNLRGPDVSAEELAQWLRPFRRPLVVIDTAASSGPFLNKLSGTNRVIVTATRSGHEQNYTRFGQYFAQALTDTKADIDQDGQVSLLEAYLTASHQVNEFYKSKGRLVTEHALLDDNGDGLGTPPEWFRGLRATKQAKDGAALDGLLAQQFCLIPSAAERLLSAEQVAQRDALEKDVLLLREKKTQLPEDEYYQQLDELLLQLAKVYAASSSTNLVK